VLRGLCGSCLTPEFRYEPNKNEKWISQPFSAVVVAAASAVVVPLNWFGGEEQR
jgi:hypothetical protein